ncbi:phosphoribosylamine--glycine ligase [Fervidobacterium sp.]
MRGVRNVKRVLILGSGGREHAIGWAFKNAGCEVSFYPGNAGTKLVGKNLSINEAELFAGNILTEFDLVIPGSEDFLVKGIADGRTNVFGPDSAGAKLEGSKCFAKLFMEKYNIPTAKFQIARNKVQLVDALKSFTPPYVIKADGLAQGKGVIIEDNFSNAIENGSKLMDGTLIPGVSGPVVVDEFLKGWELSAIAIVNGRKFALLPFTRDYKRAFTGNKGPNTGGMGAYGPVEINQKLVEKIRTIFEKTLFGLEKEGIYYKGFLYVGLMIVEDEPYVLEYNVRLGDPETEVIVAMEPEKFVENVLKAFKNDDFEEYRASKFAVDVVVASEGYPENPRKGQKIVIENIDNIENEGNILFFAGVKEQNGELVVSGGRVLHSVGIDNELEKAREKAYENIQNIHFEGLFYREDIAL